MEISQLRLQNQELSEPRYKKPEEVIRHLGAMQAQDYAGAKWGIGTRLQNISDNDIEKVFNEGRILRTHVMRPTWHLVLPEDIRWMLALTAPRIKAAVAGYNRKLQLDDALFEKSNKLIAKVLAGGNFMTRQELGAVLRTKGFPTDVTRLAHIVSRAELDAIVCSGPRKGKQFTYALLEDRAPGVKSFNRDNALAELTKRYFVSHGPATIQDCMWWSGLTSADVRAGIVMNSALLKSESLGGKLYWMSKKQAKTSVDVSLAYLIPTYDEFLISYKDRGASLNPNHVDLWDVSKNGVFNPEVVIGGKVVGIWKKEVGVRNVKILVSPFTRLNRKMTQAIQNAAERYAAFLNLQAQVSFTSPIG